MIARSSPAPEDRPCIAYVTKRPPNVLAISTSASLVAASHSASQTLALALLTVRLVSPTSPDKHFLSPEAVPSPHLFIEPEHLHQAAHRRSVSSVCDTPEISHSLPGPILNNGTIRRAFWTRYACNGSTPNEIVLCGHHRYTRGRYRKDAQHLRRTSRFSNSCVARSGMRKQRTSHIPLCKHRHSMTRARVHPRSMVPRLARSS